VVPAVVELNLTEVLARYLVHIFNIDPKTGPFQHSGAFLPDRHGRLPGKR
jgi:hypothetical protein